MFNFASCFAPRRDRRPAGIVREAAICDLDVIVHMNIAMAKVRSHLDGSCSLEWKISS
jgi:hypothetical protein